MGVVDEYDPFNPNDYDLIMKERRKKDEDDDDDGDFRRRDDRRYIYICNTSSSGYLIRK